jgi:hypothetical protein
MSQPSDPILFLDLDDVVVLDRPSAFDKHRVHELEAELCRQVIHPPAGQAFIELLEGSPAKVVVTSNWLRFTSRPAFERLFRLAGYPQVADALHEFWCAPKRSPASRLQVIDEWLSEHHHGEPYCIVDDTDSGPSLLGSSHDKASRVLLCTVGVGLHRGHIPFVREALARSVT